MTRRLAVIAAIAALVACGRGDRTAESDTARQQVEQGAGKVQQGAQTIAEGAKKGSAEMAAGLQQMAGGLKEMARQSAKPVPFEALMPLLPEIPGWSRGEPRGESGTMPMAYSRVEARYTSGDRVLTMEITDTALSQFLLAPLSMFLASGYAERSNDGFKRSVTVGGHPGFEDWNAQARRAHVTVVVGGRYVVEASADDVDGIDVARQAVDAVDLSRFARLQ